MPKKNPDQKRVVHSPKGGAPIIPGNPGNSGGKKGRSGRKPDEFKELCRDLATSAEVLAVARAVLKDRSHTAWLGAWKHVTEHGYGKAAQSIDVTSGGEKIVVKMNFGGHSDE